MLELQIKNLTQSLRYVEEKLVSNDKRYSELNSENMGLLAKIRELEAHRDSDIERNNYELEIQI